MGDCCPVCGGALQVHLGVAYHVQERVLVSSTYSITFTKSEDVIFHALWVRRSGGIITREFILERLYGDDPEGGPENCDRVVHVLLSKIRKKLADNNTGLEVVNNYGTGWTLRSKVAVKVAA